MYLPDIIKKISKKLQEHNAKAVVVGGSVRDHFLNIAVKDYDIEVYGLGSMDELEEILLKYGSVNIVGKSFGVLKFTYNNEEYDFSFPRVEEKVTKGHKGFDVAVDGSMSFKEASKRRDFTINAMGYDIEEKTFLDPFDGRKDMKLNILRHIDDESFVEDPLRVYRAVQFVARFSYVLADETKKLCKYMVKMNMLDELPKERVYSEFKKLLLKAKKPSIGFEILRELEVLKYFPELKALIAVPQNPKWHPEGDVWVHTLMCIDVMSSICRSECPHPDNKKQKLKLMFAILCHDFGKPSTTAYDKVSGCIRSIGHEVAGLEPTKSFIYRLTDEHDFIKSVLPLVKYHMQPSLFFKNGSKSGAIRRLATKVNIEELVLVAKADFLGRTSKEAMKGVYEAGDWLLERAKNLKVQNRALDNLLQGRDLISLGLKPSAEFKIILDEVYELQLDGILTTKEEALTYVKKNL
ncbi:tRNA nucleotidyltransferase [hydrothermal vent metagenome]|uniref:tRNA nucleotidyltransferase n=1 Tax=hydrothermal vent metagenome TaxID=652676 RepID=A0A1W1ECM4_9ZZZZ